MTLELEYWLPCLFLNSIICVGLEGSFQHSPILFTYFFATRMWGEKYVEKVKGDSQEGGMPMVSMDLNIQGSTPEVVPNQVLEKGIRQG